MPSVARIRRPFILGLCLLSTAFLLGCEIIGREGLRNGSPRADSQALDTELGVPLTVVLTGTDPEGEPLTFEIEDGPVDGALDASAIPEIIYAPDPSFTGVDSFTFRVSDGVLDSLHRSDQQCPYFRSSLEGDG